MPTRDEELEQLKKLSPYSLPDNPSQSGWTTRQVKGKFYQGLFYLYNLIDDERTDIASVQDALDNLNLEDYVTETEAQGIVEDAMPHVGTSSPDITKTKVWFDTTEEENDSEEEALTFGTPSNETLTFGQ